MSDAGHGLSVEPVPRGRCVTPEARVFRDHSESWKTPGTCRRCGVPTDEKETPMSCKDSYGNEYPEHTKNPGSCHRCGAPTGS